MKEFIEEMCDKEDCPIRKNILKGDTHAYSVSNINSTSSLPGPEYAEYSVTSSMNEGYISTTLKNFISIDCLVCSNRKNLDMCEYNLRHQAKKELEDIESESM